MNKNSKGEAVPKKETGGNAKHVKKKRNGLIG